MVRPIAILHRAAQREARAPDPGRDPARAGAGAAGGPRPGRRGRTYTEPAPGPRPRNATRTQSSRLSRLRRRGGRARAEPEDKAGQGNSVYLSHWKTRAEYSGNPLGVLNKPARGIAFRSAGERGVVAANRGDTALGSGCTPSPGPAAAAWPRAIARGIRRREDSWLTSGSSVCSEVRRTAGPEIDGRRPAISASQAQADRPVPPVISGRSRPRPRAGVKRYDLCATCHNLLHHQESGQGLSPGWPHGTGGIDPGGHLEVNPWRERAWLASAGGSAGEAW
jgi:hypothetical protein